MDEKWKIELYENARGEKLVEEFFDSLEAKARLKIKPHSPQKDNLMSPLGHFSASSFVFHKIPICAGIFVIS